MINLDDDYLDDPQVRKLGRLSRQMDREWKRGEEDERRDPHGEKHEKERD